MGFSRLIAGLILPLSLALPGAVLAQQSSGAMSGSQAAAPSPAQMQAAVKSALQSAGLTMAQKRQIIPMVQNYKAQTEGADAATKKSAQETLLKNIYGVLTPDQQTKFKASLEASLANPAP
jgi:predicted signal transduction protein with EAL and GGDEF domain